MRNAIVGMILSIALAGFAQAATVLVEAESFAGRGGWVVDQQSIEVMGSPYLLAHGLGKPVADATTTVTLPEPGRYRVFVRTKDWVARWNAPGTPGRFQLLIDGRPLDETFGTKNADWFWHNGGTVFIDKRQVTLRLKDLTGFEGRCDAIVLSNDPDFRPPNALPALTVFRRKLLGLSDKPQPAGRFDLVVVGGGTAGCCTAISAARLGLNVALIQNRPVLGGNSSSEVRVWIQGGVFREPYPVLGEIVEQLNTHPKHSPGPSKEDYGDDVKLKVVTAEKNLSLFLNEHVFKVETDAGRIRAVVSTNILTGRESRFAGRLFADCTGDGTVGFLAGADYEVTPKGHMGASNLWCVVDTGKPRPFPRCPWALDLTNKPFPTELRRLGVWFWESGFDRDTIRETEAIRDHNLRAMYGAWDCLKNAKKLYPNHKLHWAAYISGKRESRRLLGDVILTKDDVLRGKQFPDGCAPTTWSIDLHYPDPRYAASSPGDEFISRAEFTRFKTPYLIPYRCLYCRNVPNLMMAGRNVSVTHEALGTVRVMATGGVMGEVLGRAALLCKKHDADPRDVYEKHLDELKHLLQQPTSPVKRKKPFEGLVGENVARKAKIVTSGDADPQRHPAGNLNDGHDYYYDNGTLWLSKSQVPNWVELQWEQPKTIAAARIVSGYKNVNTPDAPITTFVLQYHDGEKWRDIPGTRTVDNTNIDWRRRFKPVTARRIRLRVEKTWKDVTRIWEIELYEALPKKR